MLLGAVAETPDITQPGAWPTNDAEKIKATRALYSPLGELDPEPKPLPGPDGHPYTLAMLQQIAAENSPVLKQAASDVQAAWGNVITARLGDRANNVDRLITIEGRDLDGRNPLDFEELSPETIRQQAAADGRLQLNDFLQSVSNAIVYAAGDAAAEGGTPGVYCRELCPALSSASTSTSAASQSSVSCPGTKPRPSARR